MKTNKILYGICLFVLITGFSSQISAQSAWLLGQKAPGKNPVLFAPKIDNLAGFEYFNLVLSPSGNEICFEVRDTTQKKRFIHYMKKEQNTWSKPVIIKSLGENGQGKLPTFSPCGKKLFFNRNGDFWVSNKTKTGWTAAVKLNETISSTNYECGLSLASNGNFYFASSGRSDCKGKLCDIYYSKSTDGKYNKATSIETVNTMASECVVSVSPDERFLVISRWTEHASIELVLSVRKEDGSWSTAQDLGSAFNSVHAEYPLCFSADGKYFFFNRFVKKENVFTYELYWVSTKVFEDYSTALK